MCSCGKVLLKWKRDREIFWHRHQKGDGECPPASLNQSLIYFYQTHSHNIHLKLTRLELTIERSYQIHSHNILLKITRLVRRFLLRRNMIHCYIGLRQSSVQKSTCPFLLLGNSRPLSPSQKPQTPFSSSGTRDFLSTYLGIDSFIPLFSFRSETLWSLNKNYPPPTHANP